MKFQMVGLRVVILVIWIPSGNIAIEIVDLPIKNGDFP